MQKESLSIAFYTSLDQPLSSFPVPKKSLSDQDLYFTPAFRRDFTLKTNVDFFKILAKYLSLEHEHLKCLYLTHSASYCLLTGQE